MPTRRAAHHRGGPPPRTPAHPMRPTITSAPIDAACTAAIAAVAYAVAGWAVLPLHTPRPNGACSCRDPGCRTPGKHPRYDRDDLRRGLHDASTDPGQITRWWTRWPDANVAIRTGRLVVLDVDGPRGA